MSITSYRRTLGKARGFINRYGYEIVSSRLSYEKSYYMEDDSFSIPEIKILIYAVQETKLITEKKSTELTYKLSSLSGSYNCEILKSNIVCFDTIKNTNEDILERAC